MSAHIEFVTEKIVLAGNSFLLQRVKNIDDLLDVITDDAFNVDERLPYWAELWPSARALTEYILGNASLCKGKKVLELGCGIGLTTMAVYKAQPAEFTATDYEQAALDSTRSNFRLNKISPPRLKILDWRSPAIDEKFEVIVASDIAYEQRFFEPLVNLFDTLLQPTGEIILAEPNRQIAQSFFGKLTMAGYQLKSTIKVIEQGGKNIRVNIYRISK